MSPIHPVPRTNCAHTKTVVLCAQLVRDSTPNCAHSMIGVRAVRGSQGVILSELTNRAHPPIPPRGVCGQLAGTPEPTARAIAVGARSSKFADERRGERTAIGTPPRIKEDDTRGNSTHLYLTFFYMAGPLLSRISRRE